MVGEFVGGWLSGSLALMADAGHMATDAASMALSLVATWIATKPADDEKTFGYHRAEILAALANGAALIAVAIWIFFEAWSRLNSRNPINGVSMALIAAGGLGVNIFSLVLVHLRGGHSHDDLNLHGVWLHILSDALGSLSALTAAFLVWRFGWVAADPIASLIIAAMIFWAALRLAIRCVDVLLEAVPHGVVLGDIRSAIRSIQGVGEVHDLHVWVVSNRIPALSAHVCVAEGADHARVLREIHGVLKNRFRIDHSTVQLEPPSFEHAPLHA